MKVGIHGRNVALNPNLEDGREGLPPSARMKKNSMKMGLPNGEMNRKRDGDVMERRRVVPMDWSSTFVMGG